MDENNKKGYPGFWDSFKIGSGVMLGVAAVMSFFSLRVTSYHAEEKKESE